MDKDQESVSEVFVISDGTGETCAAAVRAVMLQFQNPWRMRIFGGIRHPSDVNRVVTQASEAEALLVFSLVDVGVVDALQAEAERQRVVTVDLLSPLIAKVAQYWQVQPRLQPGLLHGFTAEYFQRVEAVEFAVRHDDGANAASLFEADIVLTGPSRTSKTPLSIYLAQRGYKTGNVPLVARHEPPQVLLELDRRKVFGLLIDPGTLQTVRKGRLRTLGWSASAAYTDYDSVVLEINRARRLFRARGWRTIDISGRAVEESASRILELYQADPPANARL
jgi:regulator of PEP synthase PpsR (kinase-PPPase family)